MKVLPKLKGAFSFVLMDEGHVIGVRDPNGFWPLCLGKLDNGWALASESPALDIVGAQQIREVAPGDMVIIDATGVRTVYPFAPESIDPKLCLMEFVYFHRPDGRLYQQSVHAARVRMGEQLAEQAPVTADLVMGVPESGIPAAEGFAKHSGIPFGFGLVKPSWPRSSPEPADARWAWPSSTPRQHRGQAAHRRRRLHRAGTTTRAMVGMLLSAVPPRSTCASPPRPTPGPASTAWTPAPGASSSPPASRSARSPSTSTSTRWPTSTSSV
jgi:hypothetical protein